MTRSVSFRRRPSIAVITATVALLVPGFSSAQGIVFPLPGLGPTSYTFTSTTLGTFRTSNFDTNRYDDNVLTLTERYDSAFAAPPWRMQIRLDGSLPLFAPDAPPCTMPGCQGYLRGDLRIERLALRYQQGLLTGEIGDYYTVIGRGIALSFRKVDPIGLDTTLRGARVEVDSERVTIRAFTGYANPQNLDPITLAVHHDWGGEVAVGNGTHLDVGGLIPHPRDTLRPGPDILGGGELSTRLGPDEDVELAAHALRVHFPESVTRDFDVDVIGYRVSVPSLFDGTLALYGEVHALRRIQWIYRLASEMLSRGTLSRQTERFGRALYASAQWTAGNWNGLLEWKDYTNFFVSPDGSPNDPRRIYSAAPSLERDDVQFRTNANTRGGRMRIEHAFRPGPWTASFTAVATGFTEETDHDPWSPQGFGAVHGYFTIRRRSRATIRPVESPTPRGTDASPQPATPSNDSSGAMVQSATTGGIAGSGTRVASGDWLLIASVGYRHEFLLGPRQDRPAGDPDWQIVHGDIDVAFGMGANHSIDVRLDGRLERRWTDFLLRDATAGYYTFTRSGLSVTWSYMDRLTVALAGRVDSTNLALGRTIVNADGTRSDYPVIYPAGEVRYMFIPGSTVRLFVGMTPGGRLCTGGVCRDVPPFQGAIAEVVLRI